LGESRQRNEPHKATKLGGNEGQKRSTPGKASGRRRKWGSFINGWGEKERT